MGILFLWMPRSPLLLQIFPHTSHWNASAFCISQFLATILSFSSARLLCSSLTAYGVLCVPQSCLSICLCPAPLFLLPTTSVLPLSGGKEGGAAAFPSHLCATICTPIFIFFSLSICINYSYPKYDCYMRLKYVEDKRHCTTLNKWWADNDKMMLGRNIIEQHYINDGQTMTRWC